MSHRSLSSPRTLRTLGGALCILPLLVYAACSPTASTTAPTDNDPDSNNGGSGGSDDGIIVGSGGDPGGIEGIPPIQPDAGAFPAAPVYDEGVTEAEAAVFSDPENFSAGVCVYEPHLSDALGPGALYPMNWLRPRFRWTGTGSETIWEIRLTAASQTNPIRVYTRSPNWIMPKEMWDTIAAGVADDITVTVRGSGPSGVVGMRGNFRVTSALAGGSMVFWGTSSSVVEPGSSRLYGFTMGDEAVVDTLRAEQVTGISGVYSANGVQLRGETTSSYIAGIEPGVPRCIGCHNSTPDGTAMVFADDYPWNMGIASIEAGAAGTPPAYVTAGALELMKIPFLGTSTMMPVPWASGDRTVITTMGRRNGYIYIDYSTKPEPLLHDLVWMDLSTTAAIPSAFAPTAYTVPYSDSQAQEQTRVTQAQAREAAIVAAEGTAWGVLATELGSVSNPTSSKTGLQLAYSVSESSLDGHPDWHNNTSDIHVLNLTSPRAASGASVKLAGASEAGMLEYYPSYSPDDAFIAFNRAPQPTNLSRCKENPTATPPCVNSPATLGENPDGPYYNRKGEIAIVPAAGGAPHRLRANDPVMCSGETSPGVLNSWPKWSSAVRNIEGKNYYFIIFSSARGYEGQFELARTQYTPPISTKSSQLYMSVVEHDPATGAIVSYAPIYLWNQNYLATGPDTYEELKTANLTPAWEDFSIPPVPPVVVVVR
jgi:hypothetical protein